MSHAFLRLLHCIVGIWLLPAKALGVVFAPVWYLRDGCFSSRRSDSVALFVDGVLWTVLFLIGVLLLEQHESLRFGADLEAAVTWLSSMCMAACTATFALGSSSAILSEGTSQLPRATFEFALQTLSLNACLAAIWVSITVTWRIVIISLSAVVSFMSVTFTVRAVFRRPKIAPDPNGRGPLVDTALYLPPERRQRAQAVGAVAVDQAPALALPLTVQLAPPPPRPAAQASRMRGVADRVIEQNVSCSLPRSWLTLSFSVSVLPARLRRLITSSLQAPSMTRSTVRSSRCCFLS
jgi:hypothetical protein